MAHIRGKKHIQQKNKQYLTPVDAEGNSTITDNIIRSTIIKQYDGNQDVGNWKVSFRGETKLTLKIDTEVGC